MRAIVLAAGAGSRLWPYTATRPKPMVPVAGRPILGWLLEALATAGVLEVQLVVGYKASRIQSAFQDGKDLGLDISYVRQEVLLGTGAALATALEDGGVPEGALVLGGDNIVDTALVEALLGAGANHLAVARSHEPSKYGVVHQDQGTVRSIQEKPPITGDALVSTGVAVLGDDVLEQIPTLVEGGMLGLAQILDHVATAGPGLRAVVDAGLWRDAVYPWDLLHLTDELVGRVDEPVSPQAEVAADAFVTGPVTIGPGAVVEPGAILRGPASLGANVRVESGAIINRSIVMDDATVGAGALLERSILGDGSHVNSGAVLARGQGVAETQEGVHRVDDLGALVGEGVTVEGGALLHPGTLVGNRARIRAGARARGTIQEEGEVS